MTEELRSASNIPDPNVFTAENDFIHPWNSALICVHDVCMSTRRKVLKVISMNRLLRPQAHDLNMRVTDMSIDARNLSVNIFPSVSIHISRCVFLVFSVFP